LWRKRDVAQIRGKQSVDVTFLATARNEVHMELTWPPGLAWLAITWRDTSDLVVTRKNCDGRWQRLTVETSLKKTETSMAEIDPL